MKPFTICDITPSCDEFISSSVGDIITKIKKKENRAIEVFQNSLTESLELYNQIRVQNREAYFLEDIDKKAKHNNRAKKLPLSERQAVGKAH